MQPDEPTLVTVLFADLVGSPALRAREPPPRRRRAGARVCGRTRFRAALGPAPFAAQLDAFAAIGDRRSEGVEGVGLRPTITRGLWALAPLGPPRVRTVGP